MASALILGSINWKISKSMLKFSRPCTTIRADSINKLRKQYDAFLEEDRKRKERNEDILAKLDKMRNSVTRYKANVYLDHRLPINDYGDTPKNPINVFGETPKNPIRRYNEKQMSTEVDVLTKHIDETHLLHQISKKYILIPKLRTVNNDFASRAIQQDNNNDNDWKSKYSILDKLKQSEKEQSNYSTELPIYPEDDPIKLSVTRHNIEGIKKETEVNEFSSIPQSPPRDIGASISENFTIEAKKDILEETQKQVTYPPKPNELKAEKASTKANENIDNNFSGGIDAYHQQQPKSDASLIVHEVPTPEQNYCDVNAREQVEPSPYQIIAQQQHNLGDTHITDKHEIEDTEKSYFGDEDITHVEVLHPDELVQELTNDTAEIGGSQDTDYPIDIINVQEFTPGNDVNLIDGVNINPEGHAVEQEYIPPNPQSQYVPESITAAEQEKDVAYHDPVNVYPDEQTINEGNYDPSQQYVTAENAENIDITSGIQEFETEQNEMYYSEQSNAQNYDQYNQGEVVDVYNAGYTGPVEGYDPSGYYDGAQQEGAYPVEINEHEETSQRYDPSYEQQYATNAEQNQYAEQPQSQQENLEMQEPITDAATLEYNQEYQQHEAVEQQEVAEHVEQQLDMEEGYVAQNLDENIRDKADESIAYQEAPHDETLGQNLENQAIPAVES